MLREERLLRGIQRDSRGEGASGDERLAGGSFLWGGCIRDMIRARFEPAWLGGICYPHAVHGLVEVVFPCCLP